MKRTSQAGFSLVELMVVVAIIGILATIAIPRVNRFIAKARQAEAQTNLSSIYTFNKNFYVEFQGYTNDFNAMGYIPEGKLRYNTGFNQGARGPQQYLDVKGVAAYDGSTNTKAACDGTRCQVLYGANNAAAPNLTGADTAIASPFDTFRAAAKAVLIRGATDTWTITQDKLMTNTVDGTVVP